MTDQRQNLRHPVKEQGKLALTIIPFEKEENIDIVADVTNIGERGLGIIAHGTLEPGYVIIKDGKGGYTNGVLVWSKELDDTTCHAGIQFLPMQLNAS